MNKVISISLWGDNIAYTMGSILNAEIAEKEWPDWICRFYVGPDVPTPIVENLEFRENVEVIETNENVGWRGMFWRFLAAEDPEVDVMISRDADSRLSIRDKAAVDEWLESGKPFHIMRDGCQHAWKICGGLWGCRGNYIKNMKELILNYVKHDPHNNHGCDQRFLNTLYDQVVRDAFVHDDWHIFPVEERHPFPIPRFRGDKWWENTFPEWHHGIEDDAERFPYWQPPEGPGHCPLKCSSCGQFHDNDYLGKVISITEKEKERYEKILKGVNDENR